MATTTPNFGWSVPTSSDLVKNGATAIETLGDSIDASLVDLKGGTTGQILTKATNTDMDFSWGSAGTPTFVGARVYGSAVQSIATATYALVTWNTESFDTDAFHDNSTNTSRFTIPSGKAGKYLFNLKTVFNSTSSTGDRILYFFKNGSEILESPFALTTRSNLQMSLSSVQSAAVGDYFEMYVFQTSGGAVDLDKTAFYSEYSISYLGA
jgi:hypothetical protein